MSMMLLFHTLQNIIHNGLVKIKKQNFAWNGKEHAEREEALSHLVGRGCCHRNINAQQMSNQETDGNCSFWEVDWR